MTVETSKRIAASNVPEAAQFNQITQKYSEIICRIETEKEQGTGFIIGGRLLLTNNHVLPSKEAARKASAIFYRVTDQSISGRAGVTQFRKCELDPDENGYFETSEQNREVFRGLLGNPEPAEANKLDFTIVALKADTETDPYLAAIQDKAFSIFSAARPQPDHIAYVLQCPKETDAITGISNDTKVAYGRIQQINDFDMVYDVPGAPGSSGGAVVDGEGNLIGLHYQDRGGGLRAGVLMSQIACAVNKIAITKAIIETKKELYNVLWGRLRDNYLSQAKLTVLKVALEGRWEIKLPIESIYTELVTLEERCRKEDDKDKLPDQRLETYESIFKKKTKIDLESLFETDKLKKQKHKKAVAYGIAGVGKSTWCHYITYKWAKGELWQEYDAVFWVKFRNLNKINYPEGPKYDIYDILVNECIKEGDATFLRAALESSRARSKILVIMDGYDELTPEARSGHLKHIFNPEEDNNELEQLFPHILITSRPVNVEYTTHDEFEIMGFSSDDINKYIDSFFKEMPNTQEQSGHDLQTYLSTNSLLFSLAHIPINLTMICMLFHSDSKFFSENKVITMSSLYSKIINRFYQWCLIRPPVPNESAAAIREQESLHNLVEIKPLAKALEVIAWNATKNNQVVIPKKSIEEHGFGLDIWRRLGLINVESYGASFIHLTFQERFAAQYLAQLYLTDRPKAKQLVSEKKVYPSYRLLLQMTAGYLSLEHPDHLQDFFDDLFDQPRDLTKVYELGLFAQCLEECQDPTSISQHSEVAQEIVNYFDSGVFEENKIKLLVSLNRLLKHSEITRFVKSNIKGQGWLLDGICQVAANRKAVPPMITVDLMGVVRDKAMDGDLRGRAANALGEIAKAGEELPEDSAKALIEVVKDKKAGMYVLRGSAADALANIAKAGGELAEESAKALLDVVKDAYQDEISRSCAAGALGKTAQAGIQLDESVIEALTAFLKDSSIHEDDRNSAAVALGQIVQAGTQLNEKVVEALAATLKDHSITGDLLSNAADALVRVVRAGSSQAKKAAEALIAFIKDSAIDGYDRCCASDALEEVAQSGSSLSERAFEALVYFLKDEFVDQDAGLSAASALSQIAQVSDQQREKVTAVFMNVLKDSSLTDNSRHSAADGLGKVASKGVHLCEKAFDDLLGFFEKGNLNNDVRSYAADALGQIAEGSGQLSEKTIAALTGFLSDRSVDGCARSYAAYALGQIALAGGQLSDQSIKAVVAFLKSRSVDEADKSWAIYALGKIVAAGKPLSKKGIKALSAFIKSKVLSGHSRVVTTRTLVEIAIKGGLLSKKIVLELVALLNDNSIDEIRRSYVAYALGEIVTAGALINEEGIKAVVNFLKNSLNKDAKYFAAYALGAIARANKQLGEDAIEGLVEVFEEGGDAQRNATKALGEAAQAGILLNESVIKKLVAVLKDNPEIKYDQSITANALKNALYNHPPVSNIALLTEGCALAGLGLFVDNFNWYLVDGQRSRPGIFLFMQSASN